MAAAVGIRGPSVYEHVPDTAALGRPASGPQAQELYRSTFAAMRSAADTDGAIAGLPAIDLLVLVQATAGARFVSPVDLLTADGAEPMSPPTLPDHCYRHDPAPPTALDR